MHEHAGVSEQFKQQTTSKHDTSDRDCGVVRQQRGTCAVTIEREGQMKTNHALLVMAVAAGSLCACGGSVNDGDQSGSQSVPPAVALSDRLAYMKAHGRLAELDTTGPQDKGLKFSVFSKAGGQLNTGKFWDLNICMISGVWGNFSTGSAPRVSASTF